MVKRIAVIDMGTNTFHVLITEVDGMNYTVLYSEKVPVKIGKGGINEEIIIKEARDRAFDTLQYFKGVTDKYVVNEIYATATSAIRNAKNGQEFVGRIYETTGFKVNVISGDEEAKFIYDAVNKAVDLGEEKSLIMDIGGGSVEFILCNKNNIYWKESFEIGAQRLLDLFHYHDPIIPAEIENLNLFLTEKLVNLVMQCIKHRPKTLVGSSGSFDTFSDIYRLKFDIEKKENQTELPLPIESFNDIYDLIISKNKTERMEIPGMIEMRVDMIVVASILVDYVIKNCHLEKIRVSSYSLKEGVLFNILNNLNNL